MTHPLHVLGVDILPDATQPYSKEQLEAAHQALRVAWNIPEVNPDFFADFGSRGTPAGMLVSGNARSASLSGCCGDRDSAKPDEDDFEVQMTRQVLARLMARSPDSAGGPRPGGLAHPRPAASMPRARASAAATSAAQARSPTPTPRRSAWVSTVGAILAIAGPLGGVTLLLALDNEPEPALTPCALTRVQTERALASEDWGSIEVLTRSRECWPSAPELDRVRVRALYELRRFDECRTLATRSADPELELFDRLCAAAM